MSTTTVKESVFFEALNNLVFALRRREEDRLNQLIDPDDISKLTWVLENIDETNIEEMCKICTDILDMLGQIRGNTGFDDVESLREIIYHLMTMYRNPLGSNDNIYSNLDAVLVDKSNHLGRMAEALGSYAPR